MYCKTFLLQKWFDRTNIQYLMSMFRLLPVFSVWHSVPRSQTLWMASEERSRVNRGICAVQSVVQDFVLRRILLFGLMPCFHLEISTNFIFQVGFCKWSQMGKQSRKRAGPWKKNSFAFPCLSWTFFPLCPLNKGLTFWFFSGPGIVCRCFTVSW